MKNLSLAYLLCCCLSIVNGQHSNDIVIGKIESIHSKILNEERKIWVHVPEENSDDVSQKKGYPVVYLLDGGDHFYQVVGMTKRLNRVGLCPKMIVVGIPNTTKNTGANRTRDLTPTKVKSDHPFVDESMAANSGGGENFMSFIEKELMPFINSKYKTLPYSMFIGHSLGGLTVMNTLIENPELFSSYVAIDPSMWYNDQRLLNKIKKEKFDKKYKNKALFLGIANTMSGSNTIMNHELDTLSVQKDTTLKTEHIRAILKLNTVLNKGSQKHLSFTSRYYKYHSHFQSALVGEYDAFQSIFSFYHLVFFIDRVPSILLPSSS